MCTAETYPRTLDRLITRHDADYLASLWPRVRHRGGGAYMKLWHHINQTNDMRALSIVQGIQDEVRRRLRDPLLVATNDFYSFRDNDKVMFRAWHQDGMFWSVEENDCAGMNAWVLLRHHNLNRSFDVCETHANPRLYHNYDLRRRMGGSGFRKNGCNASRIPLSIGSALVVKQYEVHRTDHDPLPRDSFRLAIGFKFMRPGRVKVETTCVTGSGLWHWWHTANKTETPCSTMASPFGKTTERESIVWKKGQYMRHGAFDNMLSRRAWR